MARTGKLSAVEVTKAKGPAVLHDGGGLYLRVSGTGAKAWVFRFQIDGKRRDMGLGPFPEIGLAEARAKALEHRKQRNDGIDPLHAREAARQARRLADSKGRTFRQVAEEFLHHKEMGWRNATHRQQWRSTLATYAYPILGELPVSAIDTGLVMHVLTPIWTSKTETASRLRGRIETVLDAAKAHGYRDGENPARWRGHLKTLLADKNELRKVEHLAALPYVEVPEFFTDLRSHQEMAARALEFVILTAVRSGEALRATWGEVDLDAKVWTVPASRMKAKRAHQVPLSEPALAILKRVRPLAVTLDGEPDPMAPLFPGRRRALPMSNMTLIMLLRRMGRGDLTVHGFRSSFRDWAAERTAFAGEIAEMALAHLVGTRVEQAYRRSTAFEKRAQLMEAWARFCTMPAVPAEVVPLHAGA